MIKLIATDLDGTLLNVDHQLDDHINSGIQKILDSGVQFCAATGRNPGSPTLPGFDHLCHHVFLNGALVKDKDGKTVYDVPLRKDVIAELVETFPHIYFEFCTENEIFCPKSDEGYIDMITSFFSSANISGMDWRTKYIKKRFEDIRFGVPVKEIQAERIYKCNVISDPVDSECQYIKGLSEFIEARPDRVINIPFSKNAYEFTDPKGNKGDGVTALCKHLGIKEDEVLVYGDGENDLAMLNAFSNSFAPNTAMPKAKAAAKHIIGPYDEYSVINHMLEMIGK